MKRLLDRVEMDNRVFEYNREFCILAHIDVDATNPENEVLSSIGVSEIDWDNEAEECCRNYSLLINDLLEQLTVH